MHFLPTFGSGKRRTTLALCLATVMLSGCISTANRVVRCVDGAPEFAPINSQPGTGDPLAGNCVDGNPDPTAQAAFKVALDKNAREFQRDLGVFVIAAIAGTVFSRGSSGGGATGPM